MGLIPAKNSGLDIREHIGYHIPSKKTKPGIGFEKDFFLILGTGNGYLHIMGLIYLFIFILRIRRFC